jgi:tripartite motif-containing protein 71
LGNSEFSSPHGVAVAPNGHVFATDRFNHRVQYFTSTGSFLGKWGELGSAGGRFNFPHGIAVAADGNRVYVGDRKNHRVQYFKWVNVTVAPASFGRVKALFK